MRHARRSKNPEADAMRDEWGTPRDIYDPLNAEHHFDVDMAATPANALAPAYYTRERSALDLAEWPEGSIWINPPYSLAELFVDKAAEQVAAGAGRRTVVLLLPVASTNKWFHRHIFDRRRQNWRAGVTVDFLDKRVKFVGATTGAPWHSMIVTMRG